jgi:hypothetical protein
MALRAGVLYPSTPLREQREPVMPVTENTPRQMVLKSGSTTLTLDKDAGKATLQRKLLIWRLKPIEAPLSDVSDVTVDTAVDRASGVEVCHPAHRRSLGTAGRGQKRCRDQCVCNPRLSGAPDLAPPSVGTLSAPTAEWVAEKFHVQEQLAGGVVRPVRHAGPHRVLSRRCDHWLHRAATDHAL